LTPQRLQSTARRLLSTRHTAAAIEHSVKRKQALVSAGPVDNAGAVTAVVDGTFNLSSTIFKTLPKGSMLEKIQLTKLDALLTFEPQAQADIEDSYQRLRPTLQDDADAALFHFMETECSFDTEHADGSFLEHLAFCREYCALHFPAGSSRVMLLHSICGVGTNAFPMSVDKLPQLASMLSAEEMAQVQAFPSILRLLVHGPLLDELAHLSATDVHLIRFHRVLDNVLLELSMPQFWQALNYQLIHLVDFLPAASWQRTSNDLFLQIFIRLHDALSQVKQLHASVHWSDAQMQPFVPGARPPTWRHWAIDQLPNRLVLQLASKQVQKYSAAIGHSLAYTIIPTRGEGCGDTR